MKRIVLLLAIGSASTIVNAEQTYIPWTFDDFNSNCEVVNEANNAAVHAQDTSLSTKKADTRGN